VDGHHVRISRRSAISRCAVGWQPTPEVSADQQKHLEQSRSEECVGEKGLAAPSSSSTTSSSHGARPTFFLGSDFSSTLDSLDAEFRSRPGMREAWAIADPQSLDPLEEITDWTQFVIFKGFTNSSPTSFATWYVCLTPLS